MVECVVHGVSLSSVTCLLVVHPPRVDEILHWLRYLLKGPRVQQSTNLPPRRILPNASVLRSRSFAVAPRNLEVDCVTVRLIRGLEGRQQVVNIRVDALPSGERRRHGSRFLYAPPSQASSSRRQQQKEQEAAGPRAPPPTTALCALPTGEIPLDERP